MRGARRSGEVVELYPGCQASRLAIYYTGRKLEGRIGQEGMETRDTMKVLQAGVIPESAWPYDLSKVDVPPPSESERRIIGSYARIQGESNLIDHLAHDGCVVLNFNVPDKFHCQWDVHSFFAARRGLALRSGGRI